MSGDVDLERRDGDGLWLDGAFWGSVPRRDGRSVREWAEEHFIAVGSPFTEDFRVALTPWWGEPMEWIRDPWMHEITVLGPAQSGKSVALGEVPICWWIANEPYGDIQYNWETDTKTKDRYKRRVKKVLTRCGPVDALWPRGVNMYNATAGLVIFPHLNFTMQGVETVSNLESDTVRFQINEELHEWDPGRLKLATQRQRAVWNWFRVNISTGSVVRDQMHQSWESGSQQWWQERCPACREWFVPMVRVAEGRPGGLKYDAKRAKMADGGFDYDVLARTVYQECPHCAHRMYDDPLERRHRADEGRWGPPDNPGAPRWHRSIRLTGAAIYNQPWVEIVRQKHEALQALKYGDREPYRIYIQRVECDFWDPEDRPLAERIEVSEGVFKRREGLEDRDHRFLVVDPQRGDSKKGESPHFWCLIRDWKILDDKRVQTRLVWEGKRGTEEDVDQLRMDYEVEPRFVLVDSGNQTQKVYRMCARYGFIAIKGEARAHYLHDVLDDRGELVGRTRKIFSDLGAVDTFYGDPESGRMVEVPFILYSKQGIRDALDLVRAVDGFIYEIPEDVSADYRAHWEAEELREFYHPRTRQPFMMWVQVARRNDLFVCECYQVLFASIVGLVGQEPSRERPEDVDLK